MKHEVKLTQDGMARLRKRLDQERERLTEKAEFIRQQLFCKCDIDQASLRTARIEKQELEDEVTQLEEALERATLVAPPQENSVEIGAFVSLLQEDTREPSEVQLVSEIDADVAHDATMRISAASPVGRQLRGHHEGDVFEVKTGGGASTHYRVLRVRYPVASSEASVP